MKTGRILTGMSLVFLLWFAPSRTKIIKKDEGIALVIEPDIPPQGCPTPKRLPFKVSQTPHVVISQPLPKVNKLFKKRRF